MLKKHSHELKPNNRSGSAKLLAVLISLSVLASLILALAFFTLSSQLSSLPQWSATRPSRLEELVISKVDPMSVRSLAVSIATNPSLAFPFLWERRVLVDEERFLGWGYYWYLEVELGKLEHLSGEVKVTSGSPVDLYVLDATNFQLFRSGLSFSYYTKPSRERVYSSTFEWTCPEKGVYYLVVKASYGNVRVKLRAEASQRPLSDDFPRDIIDREAWCIWIVNAWVAKNINYVRDPNFELVQRPEETLKLRAGDCDDVAVLLASMYEALGLKTKFALVDTNGDGVADHIAVLARYSGTAKKFLDAEEVILILAGLVSKLPHQYSVEYLTDVGGGIWVVADPLFSESEYCVGMIKHEPYKILKTFSK